MRKLCIVASAVLAFLLTNSILFASEQNLTLTLEYEIPNGVERVFSEDCELALCVQEIKADKKTENILSSSHSPS